MRALTPFAVITLAVSVSSLALAQDRFSNAARRGPTENQIVDHFDAQAAIVKARLRLSPDQEKNWDGFQNAIHDIAASRAKARTTAEQAEAGAYATATVPNANNQSAAPANTAAQNRDTNGTAPTARADGGAQTNADNAARDDGAIASMRARGDEFADMSNSLKKIADAVQPLYNSLDAKQRGDVINFVREDFTQLYRGMDRPISRGVR